MLRENLVWVVKGPRVVSQKIKKNTLTFEAKDGRHWPNTVLVLPQEIMLCLIWAAIIVDLIDGYEFDIREFLDWDMRDRAIKGEKSLLVYLCMIT